MPKFRYLIPSLSLLVGCAGPSGGVQGGVLVPYDQFTRKPELVFSAGPCHQRDGSSAPGPEDVEYELHVQDGKPVLLEHALSEAEVRLMKNRWSSPEGLHYFVWIDEVRGIEYVIPKIAGQPGLRRIYQQPRLRTVKGDGGLTVQPVGPADIVCNLLAMR